MTWTMVETDVRSRALIAAAEYGSFASSHEALGVASEEWDEFKDAIHANDLKAAAHEAIDLAAVLMRFAAAVSEGDARMIARSRKP